MAVYSVVFLLASRKRTKYTVHKFICTYMVHIYGSGQPYVCASAFTKDKNPRVGLARTRYIRCLHGNNGREITKYTVIYGVHKRFRPTLLCVTTSYHRRRLARTTYIQRIKISQFPAKNTLHTPFTYGSGQPCN